MPNVLIRDIPSDDLEEIRAQAADRGMSLQSYLRDALHAQAAYVRRQRAVRATAERLRGRPSVPERARDAVHDAIDQAHVERAGQVSDRSAR